MSAADLTVTELAEALAASAVGVYADEAAVELLIAHETWIRRGDFRRYITHWRTEGMARIEWARVAAAIQADRFAASSTELRMLAAACSLAGHGSTTLRDVVPGLGETNARILLEAIARCAGWHDNGTTATVTGDPALVVTR